MEDDIKLLPLSQGHFAKVDATDFEWLSQWKWRTFRPYGKKYAVRSAPKDRVVLMHRQILSVEETIVQVDHIDGDGLNNCRYNLRKCSRAENRRNTPAIGGVSRYRGVTLRKDGKWVAVTSLNDQHIWLGSFDSEEEAARAYDSAIAILHGEFAHYNFPDSVVVQKSIREIRHSASWNRPKSKTGFYGVYKSNNGFTASVRVPRIGNEFIGYFSDARDAAVAYDKRARELGKRLFNFPESI